MKIRAARSQDAETLASILIESRRRHVAFARLAHTDAEIHEWMRTILIPRSQVWLIETERGVVGFTALSRSNDESWIDQFYLHPDMTGRGYGRALLNFVLQQLPAPIFLYTFQQNSGARRFYEGAGFIPVKFTDGQDNEERCPDVLYRRS